MNDSVPTDLPESEAYWIDHLTPCWVCYADAENCVRQWTLGGRDEPRSDSIADMNLMADAPPEQNTLRRVERVEAVATLRYSLFIAHALTVIRDKGDGQAGDPATYRITVVPGILTVQDPTSVTLKITVDISVGQKSSGFVPRSGSIPPTTYSSIETVYTDIEKQVGDFVQRCSRSRNAAEGRTA